MGQDDSCRVADSNDILTLAELQAKLRTAEAELNRTKMQRDFALRLLRQQQTMSTARFQNDAYTFLLERDTGLTRLLTRMPRRVKDLFPVRLKKFVRNVIVRIQ